MIVTMRRRGIGDHGGVRRRAGTGPAAGSVVVAVVLAVALSGCSGFFRVACTLQGWSNSVEVRVPGSADPASGVEGVGFCQERGCTPGLVVRAAPVQPDEPGDATPAGPADAPPAPTSTLLPSTTHEGDVWIVSTSMATAERGRVALFGADDRVLVERSVDLRWVRTGGSEQCGGPSTASVTVELP